MKRRWLRKWMKTLLENAKFNQCHQTSYPHNRCQMCLALRTACFYRSECTEAEDRGVRRGGEDDRFSLQSHRVHCAIVWKKSPFLLFFKKASIFRDVHILSCQERKMQRSWLDWMCAVSVPLKDQHPVGEGGCSSGTVGLLQCLVGQHPDQPYRASTRGVLRSVAPQSQALHGGPALRHGQRHWANGMRRHTTGQQRQPNDLRSF